MGDTRQIVSFPLSLALLYAGTVIVCLTTFRPVFSFFNGSDTLYLVAVVLLIIRLLNEGQSPIKVFVFDNPFLKPLLVFLLGATMSLVNSSDLISAVTVIGKYIFLFGFWLPAGAYLLNTQKRIKWMLSAMVAASLVSLVPAISDFFFNTRMTVAVDQFLELNLKFSTPHSGRFGSIMGHPNNLGFMLVIVFPIFLWRFIFGKEWLPKVSALILLYLLITGALITASRAAAGVLAVQLLVFICFMPGHTPKQRMNNFFIMIFVICAASTVSVKARPVIIVDRFVEMAAYELGEFEPDAQRIDLMTAAWRAIGRHPIAGVGVEHTAVKAEVIGVHNTILRLWSGIGICGLISICWTYLLAFYIAITNLQNTRDLQHEPEPHQISFLVTVSLLGWFLFDMVQPQFYDRFKFVTLIILVSIFHMTKAKNNYTS